MGTTQVKAGSPTIYDLKYLSLLVVNISDSNLSSVESNLSIQMEAPKLLPPQNRSFVPTVQLPVDALRTIPEEKRIIGLVSYMHHSQFKCLACPSLYNSQYSFGQLNQEEISSMVIRIELLGERHLYNLNTPIKMNFPTQTTGTNTSKLLCHYLDEHDWDWRTDGCETDNSTHNDQNDIICSCNHTTPFAVLLIREPIGKIHWEILSYISYIGCGLSAFFTALSMVIYVFHRNCTKDYSTSIHISLSGALLLLNTTFLLTEWGTQVKPGWICIFVAALMHYSLLCCFTWMAIEALHLYLLFLKVFNTLYRHYLLKLSLAGWGIPGLIVSVFLGVNDYKQFYGVTSMTMADTNQTTSICWITDNAFFYSLNLVYFTIIFIFNSAIFVAVASSICKMRRALETNSNLGVKTGEKSWKDPERCSSFCKSGLTVLGLTCLMGTTWGLAFLGSGYVNYPILYLFCILNSLQGLQST
ncbi:adhesion G-protein coupled receptor G2 [Mugil cephalus]|uniref:adhesion G-protein coupled receptor G2 n=1 Tax=Mugil cephalus TaxID=48193 RepID=UPI001FB7CAE3|nr:adhesion G-protein coupled receptor G2 [Mugil cephalus]